MNKLGAIVLRCAGILIGFVLLNAFGIAMSAVAIKENFPWQVLPIIWITISIFHVFNFLLVFKKFP